MLPVIVGAAAGGVVVINLAIIIIVLIVYVMRANNRGEPTYDLPAEPIYDLPADYEIPLAPPVETIPPRLEMKENIAYEQVKSFDKTAFINENMRVANEFNDLAISPSNGLSVSTHGSDIQEKNEASPEIRREENDMEECETGLRMEENQSYQPSTNFIFVTNSSYGTNVAIAPDISTQENVAYNRMDFIHGLSDSMQGRVQGSETGGARANAVMLTTAPEIITKESMVNEHDD